MFTVVASYRQNVHAYPSGGGDYEVANTNLGPKAGLTVASALLVDYVLTVAVSISSGVENLGSAIPFVVEHKVLVRDRHHRAADADEPARREGVGQALRDPDVRLRRRRLHHDRLGRVPRPRPRRHHAGPDRRLRDQAPSTRASPASPWSSCCCAPSPPAVPRSPASRRSPTASRPSASPSRKNAATTLAADGRAWPSPCSAASSAWPWPPTSGWPRTRPHDLLEQRQPGRRRLRPEPGDLPGRRRRLRRRHVPLRRARRRHRAGAVPGRQHRLQRLPAARLDPRPGPLPAAPAAHPRRPARLLQRHRAAGRRRRILLVWIYGADSTTPDPALHRRRLRLLHAQPDRHGPALEPPSAHRAGPGQAPPHGPLPRDQHLRRLLHRPGPGRRPRHQVHPRRLGGAARHGDLLRDDDARSAGTTTGSPRRSPPPDEPERRRGAALPGALHRPGLQDPQAHPARPGLRQADALRHAWRRSASTSTRPRPRRCRRSGSGAASTCR